MKKILLLTSMIAGISLFSTINCAAQNKFQIGIAPGYGTQIEKPGIQVGGVYNFAKHWDGALDLFYFFPYKYPGWKNTFWALNLNAHYKFLSHQRYTAYGLAGLNFATYKTKFRGVEGCEEGVRCSYLSSKGGLNIGVGGTLGIGFGSIYAEAKYILSTYDQFAISAGIRFNI
jgi:hypothetical protein